MKKKIEIDYSKYLNTNLDDLLTYALFSVVTNKKEPTFENLAVEAYRLFPKKFGMIGYPQYPDASRVDKSWVRCRTDKHLIEGSVSQGFKLTSKGLKTVENLNRFFNTDITLKKNLKVMKGDERSRAGRFVLHVENSNAWKKFNNGTQTSITDYDVSELLFSTLDSSPQIRLQNLNALESYIELYTRDDLSAFLKYCKQNFPHLLISNDVKATLFGGRKRKVIKS